MAKCLHVDDVVLLDAVRGIVDREWTRYPRTPDKHLVFLEGGGSRWVKSRDVTKLPAVFLGMPNEGHAPEPGEPLTLWQQIPHVFNSYLWPDSWDRCMYCGLAELGAAKEIHVPG